MGGLYGKRWVRVARGKGPSGDPATHTFGGHSPWYGVFWGQPRAKPGRHAASIMSRPQQARANAFGGREGYRKASNWCRCPHAMMLMMLTGRPERWLPRARAMKAGRVARAGSHACSMARAGRAGGGIRAGGSRDRACAAPPPLRACLSLPPTQ